jgi:hypothetical protein
MQLSDHYLHPWGILSRLFRRPVNGAAHRKSKKPASGSPTCLFQCGVPGFHCSSGHFPEKGAATRGHRFYAATIQGRRGQARLNRTSTAPTGSPVSVMRCSVELYDQLLRGSVIPFTDTQTGARTA